MDKESSKKSTAGGVGFCGLLTIAFIVLKLTGVITWSWWWVLAPLWIPAAIALVIILVMLIVAVAVTAAGEAKKRGR